jgi:hypothetical protein
MLLNNKRSVGERLLFDPEDSRHERQTPRTTRAPRATRTAQPNLRKIRIS